MATGAGHEAVRRSVSVALCRAGLVPTVAPPFVGRQSYWGWAIARNVKPFGSRLLCVAESKPATNHRSRRPDTDLATGTSQKVCGPGTMGPGRTFESWSGRVTARF